MTWVDDYNRKVCSADDAVRLIESNAQVYYGGNAAIPGARGKLRRVNPRSAAGTKQVRQGLAGRKTSRG